MDRPACHFDENETYGIYRSMIYYNEEGQIQFKDFLLAEILVYQLLELQGLQHPSTTLPNKVRKIIKKPKKALLKFLKK